jgi:hypothetical protein
MRCHINIRRFLNRKGHHAGAHVIARVGDTSDEPDFCRHTWCPIVLEISGCSRVVSLDFELYTAAERRNSLHKLDVLIDTITQFRDAVAVEAARYDAVSGKRCTH